MRARKAAAASLVSLVVLAVPLGVYAGGHSGSLELWATGQDSGTMYVVRGESAETFTAPGVIQNPHLLNFSPRGTYAYIADVGNGRLHVVDARRRTVVTSISFPAGTDTHQGKPSPDGRTLLVSRRAGSQTLFKVLADERARTWTLASERLPLGPAQTPICAVFRRDGNRAYVSLAPSGIAAVDVQTMTLVTSVGSGGVLPTAGGVACGMVESRDGQTVYVISSGGPGHLYRLDTQAGTLTELVADMGAADLHYPALSRDERTLYASSRGNEQLKVVDLASRRVDTISLDATPGAGNDQPDGVAVRDGTVYVTLKASGKLALVRGTNVSYLQIAAPTLNALPHVIARPAGCIVPDTRGMTLRRASATIGRAGCTLGRVTRAHARAAKGRVVSQRPAGRAELEADARVSLVVSRGPRPAPRRRARAPRLSCPFC